MIVPFVFFGTNFLGKFFGFFCRLHYLTDSMFCENALYYLIKATIVFCDLMLHCVIPMNTLLH